MSDDDGSICERGCSPVCTTCKRTKAPRGRSVAPAAAGSYCDGSCFGYDMKPTPCDLWPGETRPGECGACGDMTDRFDQHGHYCGCQDDDANESGGGET